MKTRTLLFAVALTTGSACRTAVPLVTARGRPAVGNLGQRGQPERELPPLVPAVAAPRRPAQPLLRPAPVPAHISVDRPLTNDRERPACSNSITKGGIMRRCPDGKGGWTTEWIDD